MPEELGYISDSEDQDVILQAIPKHVPVPVHLSSDSETDIDKPPKTYPTKMPPRQSRKNRILPGSKVPPPQPKWEEESVNGSDDQQSMSILQPRVLSPQKRASMVADKDKKAGREVKPPRPAQEMAKKKLTPEIKESESESEADTSTQTPVIKKEPVSPDGENGESSSSSSSSSSSEEEEEPERKPVISTLASASSIKSESPATGAVLLSVSTQSRRVVNLATLEEHYTQEDAPSLDINPSSRVWVVQIPKSLPAESLLGQRVPLNLKEGVEFFGPSESRLRMHAQTSSDNSLLCIHSTGSGFKMSTLKPSGYLTIGKAPILASPKTATSHPWTEAPGPIPIKELLMNKTRHKGPNFLSDMEHLWEENKEENISSKRQRSETESDSSPRKKKKKKKHKHDSSQEDEQTYGQHLIEEPVQRRKRKRESNDTVSPARKLSKKSDAIEGMSDLVEDSVLSDNVARKKKKKKKHDNESLEESVNSGRMNNEDTEESEKKKKKRKRTSDALETSRAGTGMMDESSASIGEASIKAEPVSPNKSASEKSEMEMETDSQVGSGKKKKKKKVDDVESMSQENERYLATKENSKKKKQKNKLETEERFSVDEGEEERVEKKKKKKHKEADRIVLKQEEEDEGKHVSKKKKKKHKEHCVEDTAVEGEKEIKKEVEEESEWEGKRKKKKKHKKKRADSGSDRSPSPSFLNSIFITPRTPEDW